MQKRISEVMHSNICEYCSLVALLTGSCSASHSLQYENGRGPSKFDHASNTNGRKALIVHGHTGSEQQEE